MSKPNMHQLLEPTMINRLFALIFIGLLAFIYGLYASATTAWVNFLVNHFYFTSLALSGGFIIAVAYVANGSWGSVIKRVPEAMTTYLPVAFLMSVILILGIHNLYEWSHHDVVINDPILSKKMTYLNSKFFIARIFIYFIPWILLTKFLRTYSQKLDQSSDRSGYSKLIMTSCLYLIFFAFSYFLVSVDWIMSLEPHWFSTIFGIYQFSGLFVSGLAFVTLSYIYLENKGIVTHLNDNHFHDLGKFLFGFSTFWAYIWFSQYVLIWYSNIPEETLYYVIREKDTWEWLFYLNLAVNWIVPFFALMTRNAKRSRFVLARVCILLLVGRWLDLYICVAPMIYKHAGVQNPSIGPIDVLITLGFTALYVLVIAKALTKSNIEAKSDPFFEEALELHQ